MMQSNCIENLGLTHMNVGAVLSQAGELLFLNAF